MNDDQPIQPNTPSSSVSRLPFVTEEEATAVPSFPPAPVLSPSAVDGGISVPNGVPQTATALPPSSVVPPVISPPVKKKGVPTKLVVGGSVLALLLVSVPLGVYFLMSQNQDTREKATYDYAPAAPAPDLIQNEAPSSVNSDSLNDGMVPAQGSGEEVDPNSSPLEGETAQ